MTLALSLVFLGFALALCGVPAWMWWDMRREKRASDEEGLQLQAAFQEMLDHDSIAGVEAWQRRYSR